MEAGTSFIIVYQEEIVMRRDTCTRSAKWCASLLLWLAFACPTLAQKDTGSIVGRLKDSTGAVIPGASVAVTNKATGVALSTSTNEAGEYQVLALIPGTYTVKASAIGFASQVREGIEIHVQSRPSVDFVLQGRETQH